MPYFIWPVPGFYRVTSKFRTPERPAHNGIDIGRNIDPPQSIEGESIVAIADGHVSRVLSYHDTMGNMVELCHGGGVLSRFMHNQVNLVFAGQSVRQGDVIALVGNSGRSTAPHVHVELLFLGSHVDPSDYLCPDRRVPVSVCTELIPQRDQTLPAKMSPSGLTIVSHAMGGSAPLPAPPALPMFVRVIQAMARFFRLR